MGPVPSVYPILRNSRFFASQRITSRPGMSKITGTPFDQLLVHTIRRLNDRTTGGFSRIVGAGTKLYLASSAVAIDTGYSGNPLAMLPFRPEQSPRAWMYIGDSLRMRKVLVDGTNYEIGIAPPTQPATAQIGGVQFAVINPMQVGSQWTPFGGGGALTNTAESATVLDILYDFGNSGEASVPYTATGPGLLINQLLLDGTIPVLVEYVSAIPSNTTIGTITYDSGTTGLCTIKTGSNVQIVPQHGVYLLNSGGGNQEYVQILSVTNAYPNGPATIRCLTENNHVAAETMTGEASFRTNVPTGVNVGDVLSANFINQTITASGGGGTDSVVGLTITSGGHGYGSVPNLVITGDGTGAAGVATISPPYAGGQVTSARVTAQGSGYSHASCSVVGGGGVGATITVNLAPTGGGGNSSGGITTLLPAATETVGTRDVQSTDLVHLRISVDTPANIASVTITFNLDPNLIDFATNALQWVIPGSAFTAGSTFLDLSIAVGSLTRLGTNTDLGFGTGVNGVQINWNVTGTVNAEYGGLIIDGSYGPNVVAPEGPILYQYVYRSSFTGATSNPSPIMREGLNPAGTSVLVQATPSPDPQVDSIDFYRFGASLTEYFFVGTGPNTTASFVDDFDDLTISTNPTISTDNFQPFPTIDTPKKGTCNVSGFNVTWVSGDKFNVQWYQGSEIVISGQVYNLYTNPTSNTALTILENGGTQTGVPFTLNQPTILAQPLAAFWGPYQQGTGLFCFACGDTNQPGVLFLTNGNNPDSASDVLQLEITTPSEPLINGCMYNGNSYAWSSGRMFSLYPSFGSGLVVEAGTLLPAEGTNPFVPIEVPNGKGLFSQWCLCVGPKMWFRAADGIYETVGGAPTNLTTEELGFLFPHGGEPGQPVTVGTFTIYPPDDTQPQAQKLSYYDSHLYYDYIDTQGNNTTLVLNTETGAWTKDDYTPLVSTHYGEEGDNIHSLLLGGIDGNIYQALGDLDGNGDEFTFEARMPQMSELVGGFQQARDCYLGFMNHASTNLIVNVDGTDNLITLPSTGGAYTRLYSPLPAVKGKILSFALIGESPFEGIFQRDTEFRVKTWGDQDYSKVNPFSGLGRAATVKVG